MCQKMKVAYFKDRIYSMGHLNECVCEEKSINQTFFLLELNGLNLVRMVSFPYSFIQNHFVSNYIILVD